MIKVVGVRFERAGKIYYFEVGDLELSLGDRVIVESSRGLDCGMVATPVQEVAQKDVPQPIKPVLRLATVADEKRFEDFKAKEPEAYEFCRQQILEFKLPMKLIKASYSFDGSKIVFYFTSDNRVDFRDLVKALAAHFHARIELRQVGVRDEARLVGGYSSCGRELCCAAFLNGFHPVSIKMAKKQNLALNPAKISGVCGRLMCCLYYEYDANAPDEPERDSEIAPCDNNCAACGDKPCAKLAEDTEIDLEQSVAVASSEDAASESATKGDKNHVKSGTPHDNHRDGKQRDGRRGTSENREKNENKEKDGEKTENKERRDKPQGNNRRRNRNGRRGGRSGKSGEAQSGNNTDGATSKGE